MYEGAFFKAYLTPITPNVKKMVRHKVVQQILQDFKVCIVILWTLGVVRLKYECNQNNYV